MEGIWDIVCCFPQFGDDNGHGGLKGGWPNAHWKAGIGNPQKDIGNPFILNEELDVVPCEMIWPWCLVICRGNPWVELGLPLPYPPKPLPSTKGRGFAKGANIISLSYPCQNPEGF